MSTCIIHVGMHKTGSTSIQKSLKDYSDDKFYYAKLGGTTNHSLAIFSLYSPDPSGHILHRRANRTGSDLKAYKEGIQADLQRSITDAGDRTMVISGEDIVLLSREPLIEMRNYITQYFDEIRIEAYIRPPAAYINSSFQQRVKGGLGKMDIDKLYRSYRNRFEKFDDVFGKENVHLRKFEPGEFANKCVVTDFCLRLGINLPKDKIRKANELLCMQAVSLLYTYNKFRANIEASPLNGLRGQVLFNQLDLDNGNKFRFSPDILSSILNAKRHDIAWMEQRLEQTLQEDLPDYQLGDVRSEVDLLEVDPDTIKQLASCLGEANTDGITGKTPEEVALLLKKLAIKMGFASPVNTSKSEAKNNTPSPNLSRINRARINRAEPHVVAGWAIGSNLNEPAKVTLLVNGKKKACTIANEMRKGLHERGIHPTGRCGFVFKFDSDQQLKINDVVSIQITGGGSVEGRLTANVEASKQEKKKTTKKTPIELPAKEIVNKLRAKKHNAKEIILHVGHGKTGSSYLQSALALSVKKLKVLGIDYPTHHSFTAARSGFISSGNVLCCEQWMSNLVAKVIEAKQGRILFSNELLFMKILNHHEVFAETFKDMKVNIVLFIRNPVNHMLSSYGQVVKRSGRTHPVNIFANRYNVVQCVHEFIEVCDDQNFTLKVINYSNRSHDLCAAFEEGLNIPAGTLELPPITNINRSLTASELEIQRLFNLYYNGKSSSFISDILCNELSDIKSKKVSLSTQAQAEFVGRVSKDVESVNEKLSPDSQYSLPSNVTSKDTVEQDVFTFNKKQLEVLISSICKEMNRDNGSAKNKNGLDDKSKKSSEQIKRLKGH